MTFPFESLIAASREWGLVVGVLIGFGFGFVLERAGFGRSTKLAAQFYLYDMTVFKVMFSGIVTAMLVVVFASQVGLVDLRALSDLAVSSTYLWPMLVGGLVLGVGFIVAGYCPGTSIVSAASGNIDGLVAFVGVVFGTFVYSEIFPFIVKFHNSGDLGNLYLYQLLGVPAPIVALGVAVMAVGCFIGAERVEAIFRKKLRLAEPETTPVSVPIAGGARPSRFAFGVFLSAAVVGTATLAFTRPAASHTKEFTTIDQATLARRILSEPWKLRIVDLRAQEACFSSRVPGSECVPLATLEKLGLGDDPGARELVLVGEREVTELPPAARSYAGRVLVLSGGFNGFKSFALTPAVYPGAGASEEALKEYRLRTGLYSALTGVKQAPPPPPPAAGGGGAPKKKGGGCSS